MHLLFMLFILLVGAFIPGVPVQPVLIRYPNNMVRMSDYNPTLPECTLYYTRSSATDATMELCISYRDKNENKQWFKMIDVYVMGFSCRILWHGLGKVSARKYLMKYQLKLKLQTLQQ